MPLPLLAAVPALAGLAGTGAASAGATASAAPAVAGISGVTGAGGGAGLFAKLAKGASFAPKGKPSSEPSSPDYDMFADTDARHGVWGAKPATVSPDKTQKAQMKSLSAVDATQGILAQTAP